MEESIATLIFDKISYIYDIDKEKEKERRTKYIKIIISLLDPVKSTYIEHKLNKQKLRRFLVESEFYEILFNFCNSNFLDKCPKYIHRCIVENYSTEIYEIIENWLLSIGM